MLKILQINYKLNTPVADFMKESAPVANALAAVPGLRWKIWLTNEAEREGGGIYLFADEFSLNDFLASSLIARLKTHPSLKEIHIKQFGVSIDLTEATRGAALIGSITRSAESNAGVS